MGSRIDGTDGTDLPHTEHFMPKNDSAYAEGRKAARDGALQTANPHGADEAASLKINQQAAWNCWDNGWVTIDGPFVGFQEETAVVD